MTTCSLRTRAHATASGLALLAMLAAAGPVQAQSESVLTTFETDQQWLEVVTDTATTLGAMPAGSGWSSPQLSPLQPSLKLVDVGGNQFLWLDGGESVRYTFSGLVAGTTYDLDLSLRYAAYRQNPGDTDTGQPALRITSDVLGPRTRPETLTSGCAEADPGCAPFYQAALTGTVVTWGTTHFTATGPTAYVDLAALGNARSRVAIDDVRSTLTVVSSVPEPASSALLLAGLGAIGLRARRRRQPGA